VSLIKFLIDKKIPEKIQINSKKTKISQKRSKKDSGKFQKVPKETKIMLRQIRISCRKFRRNKNNIQADPSRL
jgi:hypothetical protein